MCDATKADNLLVFDKDESALVNRNTPEGKRIRQILKKMLKNKVRMECTHGVYNIPSWVVPPEEMQDGKDRKAPFRRQVQAP